MTNQEKQKLNEKLARWVGNISHDWTDEVCGYKTTECFCKNCHRAEDYTPFPCIPDFTDSLDACFKWLVPKLRQVTISNSIVNPEGWMVDIFAGGGIGKLLDRSYGEAESPALALCLAIEKLIKVME